MSPAVAAGRDVMELLDLAASATETGRVVAGIADDQLDGPTPSTRYRVADLLDHVDGLSRGLLATARKEPAPPDTLRPGQGTELPPDWRTRIPAQLAELAAAWSDPAAWVGDTEAGGVALAARDAGMFALDELVTHGWELARATGQDYTPDGTAVLACEEFLAGVPRAPELFGPAVAVPADAAPLDRLIALTGRDPAWRPGP